MSELEEPVGSERSRNVCFACAGKGLKTVKGGEQVRCRPCDGSGVILRTRKSHKRESTSNKVGFRSYPSFEPTGPLPKFLESNSLSDVSTFVDEELSYLTGRWMLFQKVDRHRYSTDDLVTTWVACNQITARLHRINVIVPSAVVETEGATRQLRVLDIGCGLGSVLLSNAWQLGPRARCIGIEAQSTRYELAARSIAFNLGDSSITETDTRVQAYNYDLRTEMIPEVAGMKFDLITGTPPYFDPTQLGKPSCRETSGCLFEERGGIEEYCLAASRWLRRPELEGELGSQVAPPVTDSLSADHNDPTNSFTKSSPSHPSLPLPLPPLLPAATEISHNTPYRGPSIPSVFVVCYTALFSTRVYHGAEAAGMTILRRMDVIPKIGKPALFCVFTMVLSDWLLETGDTRDTNHRHDYLSGLCSDEFAPRYRDHRRTRVDEDNICTASAAITTTFVAAGTGVASSSGDSYSIANSGALCCSYAGDITRLIDAESRIKCIDDFPPASSRVSGSVYGEAVDTLCVRTKDNSHTIEYASLLRDLSKPSSFDREEYNIHI